MIKTQIAVSLVALLGSLTAWAEGQNGVGGSLRLQSEETDNARRTAVDEVSERQDRATASVDALYENDVLWLDSRYSVSNRRYAEDSQEERTSTLGSTGFRLGKNHHIAELLVRHSRQKVLASAELVNLEENNDERQILLVQPTLHTRDDSADVVFLQAGATEVDFRYDELRNSSRNGVATGWRHALSAVDVIGVMASHTEIEFDAVPLANYQMRVIALNYAVQLRRLQYLLEIGQSTTEAEIGAELSEPSYRAELSFVDGYNQYRLALSQTISDTSFGTGVADFVDEPDSQQDDTGAQIQQQMLIKLAQLNWSSGFLCGRCQVSVQIAGNEREYLGVVRKERSVGASLGFAYQFSNAASAGLRVSRREQTFLHVPGENRADFTLDGTSMFYAHQFANNLSVRLMASQDDQTSEEFARQYDEMRAGVSLVYTFK